ncbi:MAG: RDD family protein [Vicinamibacterales bacterium]
MRCPKCRYIGFEDHDRCRNCGYDFSLSQSMDPIDLPIRSGDTPATLSDLRLSVQRRRSAAAALTPPGADPTPRSAPSTPADAARFGGLTPGPFDLPLFNDHRDDLPLVSGNAPPRTPLSVRRAPVTPRPRIVEPPPREPALDFPETMELNQRATEPEADEALLAAPVGHPRASGVVDTSESAASGARVTGAVIDALIIGGIDAVVLYFTLRLCGLPFSEVRALPPVPLIGFLLMLNGGYLTLFTAAGGQTIGKMLAGTRVVASTPSGRAQRLPFGTALVRAAACIVSVLLVGAGFVMALVRSDRRALHDAVADTRVINA